MTKPSPALASSSEAQQRLAPLRQQIDAVDSRIVALLGERFSIVHKVADLKAKYGIPVVVPDRIEQVVRQARAGAVQSGFNPDVAEHIYRTLVEEACRIENAVIDGEGLAKK